ncbi:MAG: ATP-binding protein [Bacteroidota bacterium]
MYTVFQRKTSADSDPIRLLENNNAFQQLVPFLDSLPHAVMALHRSGKYSIWLNTAGKKLIGSSKTAAVPSALAKSLLDIGQRLQPKDRKYVVQRIFLANGQIFKGRFKRLEGLPLTGDIDLVSIEACSPSVREHQELSTIKQREYAQQQLLSKMSHEIHNHVGVINGIIEQIKDQPASSFNIQQLQYAGEFLLNLTENLTYYSKIKEENWALKASSFDLLQLLTSLSFVPTTSIRNKPIRFEYYQDPKLPQHVFSDKTAIYQVVLNLISNAIKYTEKGFIKLSIHSLQKSSHSSKIQFVIEDSGVGIAENQLEAIFQPHYRLRQHQNGTVNGRGLGLAIAMQLAEALGGQLSAESTLGVGSTFTFELAIEHHQEPAPTASNPLDNWKSSGPLKILLLEDNAVCLSHLEQLVQEEQHTFVSCKNGMEAMQALEQESFDLAILDLQTPLLNGLDLAKYIRSQANHPNQHIPLIAATGFIDSDVKELAELVGFNEVISKPYHKSAFKFLLKRQAQELFASQNSAKDFRFSTAFDATMLKQIFGGREDHILPIFETFVRTTNEELSSIQSLENAQNWEGVAEKLHKIKPSFALVGLPNLSAVVKKLEGLCKTVTSPDPIKEGLFAFYDKVNQAIALVTNEQKRIDQFFGNHTMR